MSSAGSMIVRQGSAVSSMAGSVEHSSHNHFFGRMRSLRFPVQLHHWSAQPERHEEIALGTLRMGMAMIARQMMEVHVQEAPHCLPVADRSEQVFIGWREKLNTWPTTKHSPRRFA